MAFILSVKKILPVKFLNYLRDIKLNLLALYSYLLNKRNLKLIAGKIEVYNVVFFLESSSFWKYNYLFKLLQDSKHFNPVVIVCPNIKKDPIEMQEVMQNTYNEMVANGFNTVMGFDVQTNEYLNVRKLNPHIIFFTNSWEQIMNENFHLNRYTDLLTCYMNYSFVTTPFKWSFVTPMSVQVWRYFQECSDYHNILKHWTIGKNAIVTGYTMYDVFANSTYSGKDWKSKSLKKVIYAPHCSIPEIADGLIALSTFLIHCESMLEIAEMYKNEIEFVFKPHPHLKNNLYHHPEWGKEKTDAYYSKWKDGDNTSIVNGEYVDLFLTSDALIHDCSSFTIEYLYTNKPVCFLSNIGHEGQSNEIALRAYNTHYKAQTKKEICTFLENVVLRNIDEKKQEREAFYHDVLLPPNGRTASENILIELIKTLKIHEDII